MLKNKILSAVASSEEKIYSSDVFSTYLYTGNGSTQTITNGIDLAGKGGLVWMKNRTDSGSGHQLFDTARGVPNYLGTDSTSAQYALGSFQSFNSNGFTVEGAYGNNTNGTSVVSWTFRKSPRFFDVVTYTGDGTSDRVLSHSLGAPPGLVLIKATSTTGDWWVTHRNVGTDGGNDAGLRLNSTDAAGIYGIRSSTDSPSTFTLRGSNSVVYANTNGATYVAYLFAHDPEV